MNMKAPVLYGVSHMRKIYSHLI